jgi:hypothetical protein
MKGVASLTFQPLDLFLLLLEVLLPYCGEKKEKGLQALLVSPLTLLAAALAAATGRRRVPLGEKTVKVRGTPESSKW